jgi:arginine decarboxylase
MIGDLDDRGITTPLMLRFSHILDHRISLINESFQHAIREAKYEGMFRGVFPIKVNQQQQVIQEICQFGERYHHGLEAGSKPELIIALSHLRDPDALIICNGYKDAEFIDLALYGLKMGLQVLLVVETLHEVPLILERAKLLNVKPRLGVRMRLSTPGSGMWLESGGDQSVFGLTAVQVIQVVDTLRAAGQLDCLELLHYHLGSQIPNIRTVRSAVSEASRVYIDLVKEGAPLQFLDIGGGLAVDYDGSHTNTPSSRNYTVEEYSADVVETVMNACDSADIPHPHLVTESGRATIAHYGVLIFDILDVGKSLLDEEPPELTEKTPPLLRDLAMIPQRLHPRNLQEGYNDAVYYRDELRSMFAHGIITLRERALTEQQFAYVVNKICRMAESDERLLETFRELDAMPSDIYYGNFSLFQSLPDAWAIDQRFPIMPIHRLDTQPDRQGIFADITCDCDGKIDRFIDPDGVRKTLPLHPVLSGERYYIGTFLVGAYQETLGDLHNLFGDTNIVSVQADENGEPSFEHEVQGDTVADVLSYVEYEPKDLIRNVRKLAESAVRNNRITAAERKTIMDAFETGMQGYTYFEA